VQIPPAVLVGLNVLACRRFADVVGGAEEPRRGEALHALDTQIHAVRLELQVDIGVLDERWRRGQGGTELLARENGHRAMLMGRG